MKWITMLALVATCAACGGNGAGATGAATGGAALAAPVPAAAASAEGLSPAAGSAAPVPPTSATAATAAPVVREVTVPAGTTLRLSLTSAVGSDTSQVEDAVRAQVRQPVIVGGRQVIPAGAEVVGHVTDVARAGRVKGRARVAYRFNALRTGGESYDIRTAALSSQAAATKRNDATKIGIGAGAGAAIGALLGGGSGAAKGAAIGGAGGTGVVLATRGKEVHLGPGTTVNVRLTAPLTLRVR
jgi:ferric-dicitrate binding protein FerR (iron transport regulator)